jgi:hypothetical protein
MLHWFRGGDGVAVVGASQSRIIRSRIRCLDSDIVFPAADWNKFGRVDSICGNTRTKRLILTAKKAAELKNRIGANVTCEKATNYEVNVTVFSIAFPATRIVSCGCSGETGPGPSTVVGGLGLLFSAIGTRGRFLPEPWPQHQSVAVRVFR